MVDTSIAICIATYKRNKLLKNCLSVVQKLNKPERFHVFVIIVDNDKDGYAREIVRQFEHGWPMPVFYFIEPDRGIANARNRLLAEALNKKAQFICFIDDDEYPDKDWLKQHLANLEKYNANVVSGPVVPICEGGFPGISQQKLKSGDTPKHIAAGNVLFDSRLISRDKLWFDRRFNLTGGEDFDFFDRSAKKGNQHIWSAEAIVYETITEQRQTREYILFRHFTGAINNVLYYRTRHKPVVTWLHFIIKATGKSLGALINFILALISVNKQRMETGLIKLASAVGYIFGLFNIIIERY